MKANILGHMKLYFQGACRDLVVYLLLWDLLLSLLFWEAAKSAKQGELFVRLVV